MGSNAPAKAFTAALRSSTSQGVSPPISRFYPHPETAIWRWYPISGRVNRGSHDGDSASQAGTLPDDRLGAMPQQQQQQQQQSELNMGMPIPHYSLWHMRSGRGVVNQPTASINHDSPSPLSPSDVYTPGLSWDPNGLDLYMRLGAVAFGLGVMIHNGFELALPWELGKPFCHSLLWVPKHLLRLSWILWQTYFIFKYHRVVFHVHKFAVQLAFSHVCVVNLCHWLKTVIGEIASALNNMCFSTTCITNSTGQLEVGSMGTAHHSEIVTTAVVSPGWYNITATTQHGQTVNEYRSLNFANRQCKGQVGEMLKPFLFPLIIEYSLIAGTLFYKLLRRVDKDYHCERSTSLIENVGPSSPKPLSLSNQCRRHYSYRSCLGYRVYLQPTVSEQEQVTPSQEPDSDEFKCPNTSQLGAPEASGPVEEDRSCHRSHTGLFFGILFFAACTISVVSLLSRKSSTLSKLSPYIFRYVTFLVLSVCILVCLIGLVQTYSLRFRQVRQTDSLEYNLLGLGLLGNLLYHLLLFVPSLETVVHLNIYMSQSNRSATVAITDTAHIDGYTAGIHLVKCTLEISEVLLQFFFIIVVAQLGPCCRNQAAIKPGRSAIVFLLIANFSLWVINTFEVRQEESQIAPYTHYYGIRSWSVMTTCLTPLLIFFRFHSSVCLAQIWSRTYQLN